MSPGRYDFARDMKAAEIEEILVAGGFSAPHDVLTDELWQAALAEVSRRRGKPTTASRETRERVEQFLASRLDLREQP